jgi:hypothetical protein
MGCEGWMSVVSGEAEAEDRVCSGSGGSGVAGTGGETLILYPR